MADLQDRVAPSVSDLERLVHCANLGVHLRRTVVNSGQTLDPLASTVHRVSGRWIDVIVRARPVGKICLYCARLGYASWNWKLDEAPDAPPGKADQSDDRGY